jgi:hypothetical protein
VPLAVCIGVMLILADGLAKAQGTGAPNADGLVKVRSAYSVEETIARIKKDIADKGIQFFQAVDQAKLAADAASRCARRPCSPSAIRRSARSS